MLCILGLMLRIINNQFPPAGAVHFLHKRTMNHSGIINTMMHKLDPIHSIAQLRPVLAEELEYAI